MTIRKTLFAVAAFAAASVFAADEPKQAVDLSVAIDKVGTTYPGRVIAAQVDPSGGDVLHYHVDVLLPNGNVAKFEFDPATQLISNRIPPEAIPATVSTLGDAVKKAQVRTNGRVISAEFDPNPQPHYHMNVRTAGGDLARVDMDIATGKIEGRKPRT